MRAQFKYYFEIWFHVKTLKQIIIVQNMISFFLILQTGSVICPLCQDQLDKRNLTQHFDEKHSESQPTTCCTGCLLVITNTDGALRKHIVKHHHNQNICETCGKVWKILVFLFTKIVINLIIFFFKLTFYFSGFHRFKIVWCACQICSYRC